MKTLGLSVAALMLTACTVEPDVSKVEINLFKAGWNGTAGPGWTDAALRRHLGTKICGSEAKLADLDIQRLPNKTIEFSGGCDWQVG